MTSAVADRVLETSTSTGTGSFTLAGAVAAYRTFASAFPAGGTVLYCIENGTSWEVGSGTFSTPSTLARTTVQASSNGGALVDFPAGEKRVFNTVTAASLGAGGLAFTYNSVAPTSPAPVPGDTWVNSATGIRYTYINDGDSSQWVEL